MKRFVLSCGMSIFLAGCTSMSSSTCPSPVDVTNAQMLGNWQAEVEGRKAAMVVLRQHPVYAEGFRGTLERDGSIAEVAGDIDQGDFTLEESRDGQRISATWIGELVEGSCGREVRGTWQAEGDALAVSFVMRKAADDPRANRR